MPLIDQVRAKLEALNDKQIVNILRVEHASYTEEALNEARAILQRRGVEYTNAGSDNYESVTPEIIKEDSFFKALHGTKGYVGRWKFFYMTIILHLTWWPLASFLVSKRITVLLIVCFILFMSAQFFLILKRLNDLALPPRNSLFFYIPLVNIIFFILAVGKAGILNKQFCESSE